MTIRIGVAVLGVLLATVSGCVSQASLSPAREPTQSSNAVQSEPIIPAAPQQPDTVPRLVVPVTGDGIPVLAIPFGGMIYQPVTGGPPVLAVPLAP
jgi:hypothetical protein